MTAWFGRYTNQRTERERNDARILQTQIKANPALKVSILIISQVRHMVQPAMIRAIRACKIAPVYKC